jgi:hypothetical protein
MEQVHEMKFGAGGKTIWTGEKASTYHRNESLQESNLQEFQGPTQITTHTEYADSSIGREGNAEILRTPLLPKREDGTRVEYGEYFECPYCRRMQRFEQKSDWKYGYPSMLDSGIC